jgi:membrane-associated phospholipid phosphatase
MSVRINTLLPNMVKFRIMKFTTRRLCWLIIILALLMVYFPINRLVTGGHALSLPVDAHIPLFPPAIIPYIFGSLLFVGFPVWASLYCKKYDFEAYVISFITATVVSYVFYIVLPTYVIRPEIDSRDCFSKALSFLYQNDYPYNAAPSGHTFYILISLFYLLRWKQTIRMISILVSILIVASTLLTKQHYMLDVISGLFLGFVAYWIGRYIQKKWSLAFAS